MRLFASTLVGALIAFAFLAPIVHSQSPREIESGWLPPSSWSSQEPAASPEIETGRLPGNESLWRGLGPDLHSNDQGAWSAGFHTAGMNSRIRAATIFGDILVFGGYFSQAGSEKAQYVVGWNGTEWSHLGSGSDHIVLALAQYGERLIVGKMAGGSSDPAASLACWDGSQWGALGLGVDNEVHALTVYEGRLIAGGNFESAGGASCRHVASWDGTRWEPLADHTTGLNGVNARVRALTVFRGELVAAGWFSEAGGIPCNGVARWDGTSWRPLGAGVGTAPRTAEALCVYDDELIVGGQFTWYEGVTPLNSIAAWNGASWRALGAGVGGLALPIVQSLAVFRGELIAGGMFQTAGDIPASSIARWDGEAWHALGSGLRVNPWDLALTETHALCVYQDRLYACGFFFIAGEIRANNIACWDGSSWSPLDPGLGVANAIRSMIAVESDLIIGGFFVHAGSTPANRTARLTQGRWEPLGEGTDDGVRSLIWHRGRVIAGGDFLHAGGTPANHVASWDGASWQRMDEGLNGDVHSLCAYRDTLVASGAFTESGSTVLNRIARWDGTRWLSLGGGMDGTVRSTYVLRDTLYAAGEFELADGALARHIAFWDGRSWKELGGGTNRTVIGLGSYQGKLVIAGTFIFAGMEQVNGVALWDGRWHSLGNGLDNVAFAVIEHRQSLYVGGYFWSAGGVAAWNVARWDGSQWHALGEKTSFDSSPGVNADVGAFAELGGGLYLGGAFGFAGDVRSSRIARWDGSTAVAIQDLQVWWEPAAVHLQWRLEDPAQCQEIVIERSPRAEGPYEAVGWLSVAGQSSMSYSDGTVDDGAWWYRLRVVMSDGSTVVSGAVEVTAAPSFGRSAIDKIEVREDGQVAISYHLGGPQALAAALRIYDVRGQLLETLVAGSKPPGTHVAVWPAVDVARGVYFVTLSTNHHTMNWKFVLRRR